MSIMINKPSFLTVGTPVNIELNVSELRNAVDSITSDTYWENVDSWHYVSFVYQNNSAQSKKLIFDLTKSSIHELNLNEKFRSGDLQCQKIMIFGFANDSFFIARSDFESLFGNESIFDFSVNSSLPATTQSTNAGIISGIGSLFGGGSAPTVGTEYVNALRGPKGDTGAAGPVGPAGSQGPVGPQGIQGLKGDIGDMGPMGPQGLKGDKGEIGLTGPVGPKGDIGPAGIAGSVGSEGPQGPQGNPGQGFIIAKVYASLNELESDSNPSNISSGEFAIISSNAEDENNSKLYLWTGSAYQYITDLSGAQGIQGPVGPMGPQGNVGPAGAMGPAGPQGDKGDTGSQGIQGPKGDTGATGAVGPQGPKGETGSQGPQGPQGIQGLQGLTGASGSNGLNGVDGTKVLSGMGAPSASDGVNGDFYIDKFAVALYGPKANGSWGSSVSLVGSQGPAGATGAAGQNGSAGVDGKSLLNGIGVPSSAIGKMGDFYIDTFNNYLYGPKGSVAWPSGVSLIGPAGATGPQGPVGATGAAGQNGTNGSNGTNGINGDQSVLGFIEVPKVKTYTLSQYAPINGNISALKYQTSGGTCILKVQKNGVDVTGLTSLGASSASGSTSATGNNSIAAGDKITLVVTSNNSATDLSFTLIII